MNRVEIEKKVLSENEQIAARLRAALASAGTPALYFIDSPGPGKRRCSKGCCNACRFTRVPRC